MKIGRVIEDHRPASMFMEEVPKGPNGEMIPRFTRITDPALISRLGQIRDDQYAGLPRP